MATVSNQNFKDKAKDAASTVSDTASNLADKARDTASNLTDKARDAASNLGDKAKDTASNLADKARDVANMTGEKAEHAVESLGSGMKNVAGTLRESMPDKGMVGNATSSVADALESSGRYLEDKGLAGVGSDVTELIKRNPIPALLIAVGVGYLFACATRSR